ncbi:MAG: SRPBCC family protein [Mycobacterium sp.]
MFEFSESVAIAAPHSQVWSVLSDIDQWWLASNTEHDSLEHLDSLPPTQVGARLRVREKIGGIPGVAEGTITAVDPGAAVTWGADAQYRWFGIPLRVGEGVTWRVEPSDEATTRVSARVWATFPRHLVGRIAAFAFTHLLNGVEKDREHTRTELRYLKEVIENPRTQPEAP